MTRSETIQSLLASAARLVGEDDRRPERVAARVAWSREIMARLRAAQKRADDAWMRAIDALPEDHDDEELEAIPEPLNKYIRSPSKGRARRHPRAGQRGD